MKFPHRHRHSRHVDNQQTTICFSFPSGRCSVVRIQFRVQIIEIDMSAQPHNSYSACVNTLRGAVYYDRVDLFTLPERIDKSMQNVRLFVIFNIFPGLNGK